LFYTISSGVRIMDGIYAYQWRERARVSAHPVSVRTLDEEFAHVYKRYSMVSGSSHPHIDMLGPGPCPI
jgi:hypothetical protein